MDLTTQLVLARIKNLAHPATPWHRSLWNVSTHTAIDEVVEYAEVATETGGSNEGLRYASERLRTQVERDCGVGSEDERAAIGTLLTGFAELPSKKYPSANDLDELRYWSERTRFSYFDRWLEEVLAEDVHVERTARLVTAAMLDFGFSEEWIVSTCQTAEGEAPEQTLRRALETASAMLSREAPTWTVAIPLHALPKPLRNWSGFQNGTELSGTLTDWGVDLPEDVWLTEGNGGLVSDVSALDEFTAVERAHRHLRTSLARHALSAKDRVAPADQGHAFVRGRTSSVELNDSRRRIGVPNLYYAPEGDRWSDGMTGAVELVSKMEEANPAVVVSAGWAAVEGLLTRGGEQGVVAADRMASIVTCSWARAELGSLGWTVYSDDRETSTAEKARKLEKALGSGEHFDLELSRDQAAILRMREVIAQPAEVLGRVEGYFKDAFRRLYNQRNLAMHRGGAPSPGLDPAVRTVPPLVGAGLDRIAVGLRADSDPIALAVRCSVELTLQGGPGGRSLCDLVDPV